MNTSRKSRKSEEYYAPTKTLTRFFDDLLRLETKRLKLKKKIRAGVDITSEKKAFDKSESLLNRRKVDVINKHIFRSMANLTVLIEKMQTNPHIRERFEDDLKALLFAESTEIENKEPIFLRFLKACVCESPEGALAEDFRLILCHYLQWAVHEMVTHTNKFKTRETPIPLENVLFEDMKRSLAWTAFLRPDKTPEFDKETRPALF